jgi:hypothetical protein
MGVKQWNEEFEKEHWRVLLMKKNFGGVGKGYEDTVGATAIGASGDPIFYEHSEQARAPHTNGPRDVPRCGALNYSLKAAKRLDII